MFAKKKAFNKTSNYVISMSSKNYDRKTDNCLGKLRALGENDMYALYDNGENPEKAKNKLDERVRCEMMCCKYVRADNFRNTFHATLVSCARPK